MPLSKERMRERKRADRAKIGFDKLGDDSDVKPIPLYNPAMHRAGDTVQVYKGKRLVTTTIPTLDGDGNPMPDYA